MLPNVESKDIGVVLHSLFNFLSDFSPSSFHYYVEEGSDSFTRLWKSNIKMYNYLLPILKVLVKHPQKLSHLFPVFFKDN